MNLRYFYPLDKWDNSLQDHLIHKSCSKSTVKRWTCLGAWTLYLPMFTTKSSISPTWTLMGGWKSLTLSDRSWWQWFMNMWDSRTAFLLFKICRPKIKHLYWKVQLNPLIFLSVFPSFENLNWERYLNDECVWFKPF